MLASIGKEEPIMAIQLDLPQEIVDAVGTELEREVLEGLLLKLVSEGRMSLGRAGQLLDMTRWEAIGWYTGHGLPYPNLNEEELADELRHAQED
jgi:predicted HTH domain antitoxin